MRGPSRLLMTARSVRAACSPAWMGGALAVSLAALLLHARVYAFLTDDAFISFRYARNLAQGAGLVFNPGFERVEGYTNFLWVLLLAAFDRVGVAPESVANALSLLATVALFALVAGWARRSVPEGAPLWTALLAPILLAATRSVAVWSTGGLETRLFETLVVGGTLRLAVETERALARRPPGPPLSALLLALAALTRPDGILVGGALLGSAGAWLLVRRVLPWRSILTRGAVFGGIVAAHFAFRLAYYGVWFPNTFYAKVSGRTWWEMGGAYLAAFAIEYAAWLWIPAALLGAHAESKRGRGHVPLLCAAVVVPHALYVARIGGDHFEYRPLDLYFPFAFLLAGVAVGALATGGRRRSLACAAASVGLVLGLTVLPWRSHAGFPSEYLAGFPGLVEETDEARAFLSVDRDPVLGLPGLERLARLHRRLLSHLTEHFVGIRQEEHRLFLSTVLPEGKRLKSLVERGTIPRDAHFAIDTVGAIPYYSDLRFLDRLGLTDAHVARSSSSEPRHRMLAHDRFATLDYAASMGVDFWPLHPAHCLFPLSDVRLFRYVESSRRQGQEIEFADTGEGWYLLGTFPLGPRSAARFPKLSFGSSLDAGAVGRLYDHIEEERRDAVARDPASEILRSDLAEFLAVRDKSEEAARWYDGLAGFADPNTQYFAGEVYARLGRMADAAAALERAVALRPDFAEAHSHLAIALQKTGRTAEAVTHALEAARLLPEDPGILLTAGMVCYSAGDRARALEMLARLRGLPSQRGAGAATRLERALGEGR